MLAVILHGVGAPYASATEWVAASGVWIIWCVYLPCLVMVLRRPNAGGVPLVDALLTATAEGCDNVRRRACLSPLEPVAYVRAAISKRTRLLRLAQVSPSQVKHTNGDLTVATAYEPADASASRSISNPADRIRSNK